MPSFLESTRVTTKHFYFKKICYSLASVTITGYLNFNVGLCQYQSFTLLMLSISTTRGWNERKAQNSKRWFLGFHLDPVGLHPSLGSKPWKYTFLAPLFNCTHREKYRLYNHNQLDSCILSFALRHKWSQHQGGQDLIDQHRRATL